jgi:hypothetical protein
VFREEVKQKIAGELARGEAARTQGFEGRARVCARRAAGMAIREYLEMRGASGAGTSAYDLLLEFRDHPEIGPEIHKSAGYLVERVNEAFELPGDVDLLAEAGRLVAELDRLSGA